jgi:hypothetical protein
MTRNAAPDRGTAVTGIFRDMRGDRFLEQLHDKLAGVVALVRAE